MIPYPVKQAIDDQLQAAVDAVEDEVRFQKRKANEDRETVAFIEQRLLEALNGLVAPYGYEFTRKTLERT